MKATSFMSESTAAYALVPNLIAQLGERFPHVVPVYFWSTREGARVGFESMGHHTVRVVGAYARRPKVFHPGDDRILVKVNGLLFSAAREGAGFGIPIFAGVPVVNSLADFSLSVRSGVLGFISHPPHRLPLTASSYFRFRSNHQYRPCRIASQDH